MQNIQVELVLGLLSRLRALRHLYETAHWLASGNSYYGDHLLFQRLYESTDDGLDPLAEKIIPLFGDDSVDLFKSLLCMAKCLSKEWEIDPSVSSNEGFALMALEAEDEIQCYLAYVYEQLEEAGCLTLGLDDHLQALASKHEGHVYLLSRRTKEASNTPERVTLASATLSSSVSLLDDVLVEVIQDPSNKHLAFDFSVALRKIMISLSDIASMNSLSDVSTSLVKASKVTSFTDQDIQNLTPVPAQRVLGDLKTALRAVDQKISKGQTNDLDGTLRYACKSLTMLCSALYFKLSNKTMAQILLHLKEI